MTVDSDVARERYRSIQRFAHDLGRPTDELLTLYVMEGFMARVSESVYSEQLVLKGGMLISTFAERRPTRDIDLQALRIPNDAQSLKKVTVEIAAIRHEDGIDFKTQTTRATVIRDQDQYSGVRVAMDASIDSANLRLKIDFSVGDPISPEPTITELESVVPGSRPITILSFPITMMLAEKIATAVSRGTANTRWRDFADILAIVRSNEIDGSTMHESLRVVVVHRKTRLLPVQRGAGFASSGYCLETHGVTFVCAGFKGNLLFPRNTTLSATSSQCRCCQPRRSRPRISARLTPTLHLLWGGPCPS